MIQSPFLSVCVITYGHEHFIKQAIESILNQETSFEYEVVVANDSSPDGTHDIVKTIIEAHPKGNLIRYFKHEDNLGMYENFMFTLRQCNSKYIAICEGDDYWTDNLKLQKQVDFLETHPDYEVCFANIRIIDSSGNVTKERLIKDRLKTTHDTNDLPMWAPTLTRVFRNRDFSNLPSAPGLDTLMILWQSQFGKLKFMNEIMGVYRKHDGGIYSSKSDAKRKEQIILTDIASLDLIDGTLFNKYFGMLFKKLVALYYLDKSLFNKNKLLVNQAFQYFKDQMTLSDTIKISIAFFIIDIPIIKSVKKTESWLIKIFNHLFIYKRPD